MAEWPCFRLLEEQLSLFVFILPIPIFQHIHTGHVCPREEFSDPVVACAEGNE